MSHLPTIITDLAMILLVAGVTTILFKKINQPLVLGYIIAGFITGEDGKDVFVHFTGLNMEGFKTLEENQQVEYEVVNGEKGPQAVDVTVL